MKSIGNGFISMVREMQPACLQPWRNQQLNHTGCRGNLFFCLPISPASNSTSAWISIQVNQASKICMPGLHLMHYNSWHLHLALSTPSISLCGCSSYLSSSQSPSSHSVLHVVHEAMTLRVTFHAGPVQLNKQNSMTFHVQLFM